MSGKEILLAVSGGIDSAVSIYLLQELGYLVRGVYFNFWNWEQDSHQEKLEILRQISAIFEIDINEFDYSENFKEKVIGSFISEQKHGFTPNPCVKCNPIIKFKLLNDLADEAGIKYYSTGHYARTEYDEIHDLYLLKTGLDMDKDQSYMLAYLNQEILSRVVFPLGNYLKKDIFEIGERLNLPIDRKSESQDLCFVKPENYKYFLIETLGKPVKGNIINTSGEIIGTHDGLQFYTIGQRKGIKISGEKPYFVIHKEVKSNTLIVGDKTELDRFSFSIIDTNWITEKPKMPIWTDVKIRYRSNRTHCMVEERGNGEFSVSTKTALQGITPGQYAVFYDGEYVIGGGKIFR